MRSPSAVREWEIKDDRIGRACDGNHGDGRNRLQLARSTRRDFWPRILARGFRFTLAGAHGASPVMVGMVGSLGSLAACCFSAATLKFHELTPFLYSSCKDGAGAEGTKAMGLYAWHLSCAHARRRQNVGAAFLAPELCLYFNACRRSIRGGTAQPLFTCQPPVPPGCNHKN
eukprot:786139-Pelagomonas_calceolata.AAC.3